MAYNKEYQLTWRLKNWHKVLEQKRRWYAKNKEKERERSRINRERKRNNGLELENDPL